MDATEHTCLTNAERTRTIILPLTEADYQALLTWQPCTRVRLIPADDGTARLETDTRATCRTCHGAGTFSRNGVTSRCKFCSGTGLR